MSEWLNWYWRGEERIEMGEYVGRRSLGAEGKSEGETAY